jgi:adenylylsulfate kinase-like enzyme
MIYWFTGQPGAGKTVLATSLKQQLDNVFHVDGDDLRAIFENKDYSETGRRKNIELAQHLAHFLHNKGQNVVVSLVSPYQNQREEFKQKLGDAVKEFYIHTTEIRGRENFHVKEYEQPTENYLDINTTNISIEECLDQIISYAKLGEKNPC